MILATLTNACPRWGSGRDPSVRPGRERLMRVRCELPRPGAFRAPPGPQSRNRPLEKTHRAPAFAILSPPIPCHRRPPDPNLPMSFEAQLEKVSTQDGFIAALDQSGGSTPKALKLYGVDESEYSGDDQMFDMVHQMRTRIMTSPSFGGDRILGAILFEMTMDREVAGKPTSRYLWEEKQIVPFLKVDKGLADEDDGVQVMKPMPELGALLDRAKSHGVFGTKMRSVIKMASASGVKAVVDQQFEVGLSIVGAGLVPIIEPEVDIHSPEKAEAEVLLKDNMLAHLNDLADNQKVMLKLTLPEHDGFYKECIDHPNVARVVALSGGYSREEANARLGRNHGMIASFSRALSEGLSAQQSDEEFNSTLDASIQSIFDASIT